MLEAARTARQASQDMLFVDTERLRRQSTFASNRLGPRGRRLANVSKRLVKCQHRLEETDGAWDVPLQHWL